jgi:hypothetical protein
MIHQGACSNADIFPHQFASNSTAMVYTDQVIMCNSCCAKFEAGWLMELYGMGLYCSDCIRSVFEAYFKEHPDEDYILARGVWSLAYQKGQRDD